MKKKGPPGIIEFHPKRDKIERDLINRRSLAEMEQEYGISRPTFSKYRKEHGLHRTVREYYGEIAVDYFPKEHERLMEARERRTTAGNKGTSGKSNLILGSTPTGLKDLKNILYDMFEE